MAAQCWARSSKPPLVVGGELSVCRGTVGPVKGSVCSLPGAPGLTASVKQSNKVLENHFPPSAKGEWWNDN